mmetsp:Transcript_92121/g.231645  ORF Transcript_92121/g.231645 Transcript_92121/m.231645 type:complete len:216 (-) Transcript_92121:1137-1784(-)
MVGAERAPLPAECGDGSDHLNGCLSDASRRDVHVGLVAHKGLHHGDRGGRTEAGDGEHDEHDESHAPILTEAAHDRRTKHRRRPEHLHHHVATALFEVVGILREPTRHLRGVSHVMPRRTLLQQPAEERLLDPQHHAVGCHSAKPGSQRPGAQDNACNDEVCSRNLPSCCIAIRVRAWCWWDCAIIVWHVDRPQGLIDEEEVQRHASTMSCGESK